MNSNTNIISLNVPCIFRAELGGGRVAIALVHARPNGDRYVGAIEAYALEEGIEMFKGYVRHDSEHGRAISALVKSLSPEVRAWFE